MKMGSDVPTFGFGLLNLKEMEKSKLQNIKKAFPTHTKAVKEILRLQEELYRKELAYQLMNYKRPVGRPKKTKQPKGLGQALLGGLLQAKKSKGRPKVYADPEEKIRAWDAALDKFGKDHKIENPRDSQMIDWYLSKERGMSERKIRSERSEMRKAVKYLRDITGIRRYKQKRKNPKN